MTDTLYYRGDTRYGLKVIQPRGLYDDGGSDRPKGCKAEIAFADSIGGAVYGAAQNITQPDYSTVVKQKDFGDKTPAFTVHVYEPVIRDKPDYTPGPSSVNAMCGDTTDFMFTGEVRFCDKKIPVKKVCSCEITKHDLAILQSYLYKNYEKEHADFNKALSPRCKKAFEKNDFGDMTCWDEFEKIKKAFILGDEDIIKKVILPEARQREESDYMMDCGNIGFDDSVILALINKFEHQCEKQR